jgi:hypothetical protein
MSRTRDKLKEAHFFLQKLEEHYAQQPDINYYLSAFISSSRSVIWVMQSEHSDIRGWRDWYNSREPTLEEAIFLKSINEVRIRSEKKEPLRTSAQITIGINKGDTTPELEESLVSIVDKKVKVTIAARKDSRRKHKVRISKRSISFVAKINDLVQVVEEFPDKDVLPICRKYYLILKSFVDECEQHLRQTSQLSLVVQ